MATAGLGSSWECLFANDFDAKKGITYNTNWPHSITVADIKKLTVGDLPGHPDLVWASFPCQDLSLAGGGAGLHGERSGTFWPFQRLIAGLVEDGRAPTIIALENVAATLTSHGGKDFAAICISLINMGYKVGARIVDAVSFLPHSRPRLFVIAVADGAVVPSKLTCSTLDGIDPRVAKALAGLEAHEEYQRIITSWVNWSLPIARSWVPPLATIIESSVPDEAWHSTDETETLIARMNPTNRSKLDKVLRSGARMIGTAYRRTRVESGQKSVRTEVRFDGIAGCLRTPVGGSSRQIVIEVDKGRIRSRLMTVREAARLMGLPDSYKLPDAYNEGYHLIGDGVAVPVVDHLARSLFDPIVAANKSEMSEAA